MKCELVLTISKERLYRRLGSIDEDILGPCGGFDTEGAGDLKNFAVYPASRRHGWTKDRITIRAWTFSGDSGDDAVDNRS